MVQSADNCITNCWKCKRRIKLANASLRQSNKCNFIVGICPNCKQKLSVVNGVRRGFKYTDKPLPPAHRQFKSKIRRLNKIIKSLNLLSIELQTMSDLYKVIKKKKKVKRAFSVDDSSVDGLVNHIVAETKNPLEPSKPSPPESLKEKEWYKKYVKGESNEQKNN